MEHVVFYPSTDGAPAFRRVASLDDAVRFVEHLRNVEDVSDFSVYELNAVPLSFRAYYKAELPTQSVASPAEVDHAPNEAAMPAEERDVHPVAPAAAAPGADSLLLTEPLLDTDLGGDTVPEDTVSGDTEPEPEPTTAPVAADEPTSDPTPEASVETVAKPRAEPVAEVPAPAEPVEAVAEPDHRRSPSFFAR